MTHYHQCKILNLQSMLLRRRVISVPMMDQYSMPINIDDDVLDWIIASLREQNAATRRIHQEAITRLESQMQRLELRKKNLITMRLDEEIEADDYNSAAKKSRRK
jgi:hypothetical protein